MIEPTFADIGRRVAYTGNRFPGGQLEYGKIVGLTALGVFVRYEGERQAKATKGRRFGVDRCRTQ
jgi:hypothetical protein